jgi:tRNAThr (cytosine32-N3)-methyltransferase
MSQPARYWDLFYRNNKEKFFKDRKWLRVEFPQLYAATQPDAGPRNIIEIGCGAGNTLFPVLSANENPDLHITGVDFSPRAVELVRSSDQFQHKYAHAAVWDLADPDGKLPEGVEPNSMDIVVLIFVLSALSPDQWRQAVTNIKKLLKPGGEILFRDYGRYDLTQLRFKGGRLLDENFYIRGDGTRVYFFTEEELREIFCSEFEEIKIATDRRLIVNRQRKLKMYRIWLQAQFKNAMAQNSVA